MTIKQILFSTLIVGCITNITHAEINNHIPTYLHYEEFPRHYDNCFVSNEDIQKIQTKAEKALGETLPSYAYHIGFIPNENHKCRFLAIYMKGSNPAQLLSARKEAIEKYFK